MNYKQISIPTPYPRQMFMEWYQSTSPGQTLRDSEATYLLNSLQHTYYQRIIQVGRLGNESGYIAEEFSRNFTLIQNTPDGKATVANMVLSKIEEWPIACECVDTLILPHVIEFEADPHRVLSEAERVLKPEGRLFILGFNPWSPQALLRYRQQSPAYWNTHFVGCHQLMEWLNLLKFEAEFSAAFGFSHNRALFVEPQSAWLKPMASLAPAYAVRAIKRMRAAINVKQAWLRTPDLVPGQAMAPPLMRKQQ